MPVADGQRRVVGDRAGGLAQLGALQGDHDDDEDDASRRATTKTSLGVTRIGPQCYGRGLENWEYWWVPAPATYW